MKQRAVLLLWDVFDYGYDEIARIVGTSEVNTRQLAARARRRIEECRPRFETSRWVTSAQCSRARTDRLTGTSVLLPWTFHPSRQGAARRCPKP